MLNTAGEGSKNDGDFFSTSAETLITALVAYVVEMKPPNQKNIGAVMDMLNDIKLKEEPDWKDETDKKFDNMKNDKDMVKVVDLPGNSAVVTLVEL